MGYISHDPEVFHSVRHQQPLVMNHGRFYNFPSSPAPPSLASDTISSILHFSQRVFLETPRSFAARVLFPFVSSSTFSMYCFSKSRIAFVRRSWLCTLCMALRQSLRSPPPISSGKSIVCTSSPLPLPTAPSTACSSSLTLPGNGC